MKQLCLTISGFTCMLLCLLAGHGCKDMATCGVNYGKVELIREGMDFMSVVRKIGKPQLIIPGEGLRINWKELVYPRGSVFLYRMRVQKVIRRTYDKVKPKQDDDMLTPYRERNIFEDNTGHKNSNRKERPRW